MTVTPVPTDGFPHTRRPWNNITPFTYRDGLTYLEVLEALRSYVRDDLITHIDNEMSDAFESWDEAFTNLVGEIEAQLQEWLNITIENNDSITAQILSNPESATREALSEALLAEHESIDTVVAQLTARADSLARAALTSIIRDEANTVNVKALGAKGDGVTDDYEAFAEACNLSRATGATVIVPRGTYLINETIDISAVSMLGTLKGYQGQDGSVLIPGQNMAGKPMLKQFGAGSNDITMQIRSIRIEGAYTGIDLGYAVYSVFEDVNVIAATGPAVLLGSADRLGPLFNMFNRCTFRAIGLHPALTFDGGAWNNNNIFNDCFIRGSIDAPAVLFKSTGGYGNINNVFNATEIAGDGIGVKFDGASPNTKFNDMYFECTAPAVWIGAFVAGLSLIGCVYGTLKNDNITGKAAYIYHASGSTQVYIDRGWITTGSAPEYHNMVLIDSEATSNLTLRIATPPSRSGLASGVNFRTYDESRISEATVSHGARMTLRTPATPGITIGYPDASNDFVIRRNGTMDGGDYGVQFMSGGTTAMTILSGNRLQIASQLVLSTYEDAETNGTFKGRVPIRTAAGALVGYIPIYTAP